MKKKLILASKSKRRKQILDSAGFRYKIIVPGIKETHYKTRPSSAVKNIAYLKASETAKKTGKAVILAADTIVFCKGEIIGKPKSRNDAKRILKKLIKNKHYVYTGIAVIDKYNNAVYIDYEKTLIQMYTLPDKHIHKLSSKHLDKAGAYAIQENHKDKLIKQIKGDYYNVVGLPLTKTINILKKCGITVSGY